VAKQREEAPASAVTVALSIIGLMVASMSLVVFG
jgi:hypothetical protein